jgi:DnaJ-class molecular chaperone
MTARDTAIEVIARALCEGHFMRKKPCPLHVKQAHQALDALLAASSEEPCPTCGGTGIEQYLQSDPCPDCDGTGTRSLLTQLSEEGKLI